MCRLRHCSAREPGVTCISASCFSLPAKRPLRPSSLCWGSWPVHDEFRLEHAWSYKLKFVIFSDLPFASAELDRTIVHRLHLLQKSRPSCNHTRPITEAAGKRRSKMPLTRDFKETIQERARRDAAFREALLKEAVDALLSGDVETGKIVLRDYINATVGFDKLATATKKSPKSLMRMLGPKGNPQTRNFFEIVAYLQKKEGLRLRVRAM